MSGLFPDFSVGSALHQHFLIGIKVEVGNNFDRLPDAVRAVLSDILNHTFHATNVSAASDIRRYVIVQRLNFNEEPQW